MGYQSKFFRERSVGGGEAGVGSPASASSGGYRSKFFRNGGQKKSEGASGLSAVGTNERTDTELWERSTPKMGAPMGGKVHPAFSANGDGGAAGKPRPTDNTKPEGRPFSELQQEETRRLRSRETVGQPLKNSLRAAKQEEEQAQQAYVQGQYNKWEAEQTQDRAQLESVRENTDFSEVAAAGQEGDFAWYGPFLDHLYARRVAHYLVRPEDLSEKREPETAWKVAELTPEQREVLLYYAGQNDFKSVEQYWSTISRELNAKAQAKASQEERMAAEKNPLAGAAKNIGASFLSPMAYLANAGQVIGNRVTGEYVPTDPNAGAFRGAHMVNDTAMGVGDAAERMPLLGGVEIGGQNLGRFVSDTGLSIGQFVSKAGMGPLALPAMGADAAGRSTMDALERGGTSEQALGLGTVSGMVEVATEKIGLDRLFRIAKQSGKIGAKETILAVLGQMATEGTEEAISEVANNLADIAVMGDKSDVERHTVELMTAYGMSREEAEQTALKQYFLTNTAWAAAGGALSGGVTGGGAAALNYLANGHTSDAMAEGQKKTASMGETVGYTPLEADAIRRDGKTFRNIIAGVDSTVASFFDKWRAGRKNQTGDKLEKLYLGKMSESTKQKVSFILGYDVDARDFILTNDDVKHIMDEHGDPDAEIRKGNLPLDTWAFDSLQEIVVHPDSITPGHIGVGKKNAGKTGVVFSKTLPNGKVVCIQFDNKGRGTMEVATLYVKEGTTTSEMDADKHAPIRTSKTPEPVVPYNATISPDTSGVKVQDMQNGMENAEHTDIGRVAAAAGTFGAHGARAMKAAYEGESDVAAYYGGFARYYQAGMTGRKMEQVGNEFDLSPAQRLAAYSAGQNDAAVSLAQEKRGAQFARVAGEDSGLVFDDYVRDTPEIAAVADRVNAVAKLLGTRVRFVDSVREGTANASISGAEVLVEKNNKEPVMFLLGHEWTHRLQETAPEQYRAFRDAVAAEVSGETRVLLDQYRAAEEKLNYEAAMDEATANYAGRMIENGEVLDAFLDKHRTDRTLLEKVRDAIRTLVRKLTGAERKAAQTAEGKLTAALEVAAEQVGTLQTVADGATMGATRNSLKEDLENGRARKETRGDFLQRATGAGYAIFEGDAIAYGYRTVQGQSAQENARQVQEATQDLGVQRATGDGGNSKDGAKVRGKTDAGAGGASGAQRRFAGEAESRGQAYRRINSLDGGGYRFTPVRDGDVSAVSRETQRELTNLGVPSFIHGGDLEVFYRGSIGKPGEEATTIGKEIVAVSNRMELPPREVAAHEAYHFWSKGEAGKRFAEHVQDNILFTSETFKYYSESISDAYFKDGLDLSDLKQRKRFFEEFTAFVSGDLYEGTHLDEVREMFQDFGEVLSSWTEMIEAGKGGAGDNSVTGEDARFSLKGSENARYIAALMERNEYLREQMKVSTGVKTDKKATGRLARAILREYASGYDADSFAARLGALYDFIADGKDADGNELTWASAWEETVATARDVLDGSLQQDNSLYDDYADLRDYLRTTKLKVPAELRGELDAMGGYGEVRKRNFGRLNLSSTDGMAIDSAYKELSELFPEFFDEATQVHPADQLARIVEVLDQLRPIWENPNTGDMKLAVESLAADLLERFYDAPQQKPTYADRQAAKLDAAKAEGRTRLSALREEKNTRIEELRRRGMERTREVVSRERASRVEKVRAVKEHYQSKEAGGRERRSAAELRRKITRHASALAQKLLRPSDKQHIPEALRVPVAAMLDAINLESRPEARAFTVDPVTKARVYAPDGTPTKRTEAFQKLREAYRQVMRDGGSLVLDPDLLGDGASLGNLDAVIAMGEKRISDMGAAELETVWRTVRAVEASVSSENKLLARSRFEGVKELADALKDGNMLRGNRGNFRGALGGIDGLLNLDMLTPHTYFHRMGQAGNELFRIMRAAEDRQTVILQEAADYSARLLKGADVRKLEKEMHTFDIGGEAVELSTAQMMELYNLSRRAQAEEHIYLGGIKPTEAAKGAKEIRRAEPYRVGRGGVVQILSALTQEQIAMAEGMGQYLSGKLAAHGNETSMRVYGYEKFKEERYWPIRVDKNQTVTDAAKEAAGKTVPQYGMTKQTTPDANNAVLIGSVFDTYTRHISEMAVYAAWLDAWEDVNRVQNFTFRDKETGARLGTVKGILERIYGKNGNGYLSKLLEDVSQGTKAGADTIFSMSGLTSAYKAAAVGGNIRVILQQPTAALRALDMLDAKYFLGGMARKGNWELVRKYAPIAQWKDWGYFEMNTGRAIKDVIVGSDSLFEKGKQWGMWLAGKADSVTWARLWNACELEVAEKRPSLKKGSEDFYRAVGERFGEVIDRTQVVDSVMHRTQFMRSANALNKMASSFMSEPSKVYNMAAEAIYDLKDAQSPEQRNRAQRHMARTAFALVASFALNAVAQGLVDAARDDDREKKYWEKFAAQWAENFLANFNPAGYVPYLKDIVSIFQGYDVSRMDMESVSRTITAVNGAYKALTGEGKNTVSGAFANLFAEAARLLGLPVANLKRDVRAVVMTAAIEGDNYLLQYRMDKALLSLNYSGNGKKFMDTLYGAMKNDPEAYEIIYADLVESGYGADKIQKAMEQRMKAAQGAESVEELERRYLSPAQQKQYDALLGAVSASTVYRQAGGEQVERAEARLYDYVIGKADLLEKLLVMKAGGIAPEEYILYKLACEVVSEDGNSSTSQEEAEAAIEMLTGLSRDEMAFLWQSTNKGWKENGNPYR